MTSARPAGESAEAAPPESIEELFAALESPLLHCALRLLGEREPAEDAVQEAFMRLHAQFNEVREPRRWLFRTVRNLSLNLLRQSHKIVPLPTFSDGEEAPQPDAGPSPDEQILRLEGIGLVRLSLASLDSRSRELVRLKFAEELSYQQISARTGLTTGHVGYLLHHALKTLAGELSRSGLLP